MNKLKYVLTSIGDILDFGGSEPLIPSGTQIKNSPRTIINPGFMIFLDKLVVENTNSSNSELKKI